MPECLYTCKIIFFRIILSLSFFLSFFK
jgi:hypothetical protein